MFEGIKNKIVSAKEKIVAAMMAAPVVAASTATTALASSNTETEALTNGITGFMTIVTTMLTTITGSPLLMVAFSASFAFLAVRLVKRLKKG